MQQVVAFCIKTSDFEKLNGFDESFKMYGEDVDLSIRVRNIGRIILLAPNSKYGIKYRHP